MKFWEYKILLFLKSLWCRGQFFSLISEFGSFCFRHLTFPSARDWFPEWGCSALSGHSAFSKRALTKQARASTGFENLDLNSSEVIQEAYISQPWETRIIYRLTQNTWLGNFCVSGTKESGVTVCTIQRQTHPIFKIFPVYSSQSYLHVCLSNKYVYNYVLMAHSY